MKSDADVARILKMDGVAQLNLECANQEIVNLAEIIERYGRDSSWCHTLVNSPSNSATLICQLPGEGNRQHHHPDWDEWWYIVEGEWEWLIEDVPKTVKQGDIVFIERNRDHRIIAKGEKVSIRLAVSRYDVAHVYKTEDFER